jgi:hypothetical protein
VALDPVFTGSKPYAPDRTPKGVFSVRGADYRNASKVAYGRDYQDGVACCGNEKMPGSVRHCQANLASQQNKLQAQDGLDAVGLHLGAGMDGEKGIVDR